MSTGTYIDMKNCEFFIQAKAPGDQIGAVNGSNGATGAVNNGAGYAVVQLLSRLMV